MKNQQQRLLRSVKRHKKIRSSVGTVVDLEYQGDKRRAEIRFKKRFGKSWYYIIDTKRLREIGAHFLEAKVRIEWFEIGADRYEHLSFVGPTAKENARIKWKNIPKGVTDELDGPDSTGHTMKKK